MVKEIGELLNERHFLLKFVQMVACFLGIVCLYDLCCVGRPHENVLVFAALTGGFISSGMNMIAEYAEKLSRYYETSLLATYGILNLLASYIFFDRMSKYLPCGCSRINFAVSNNSGAFLSCFVAGISMLVDYGILMTEEYTNS